MLNEQYISMAIIAYLNQENRPDLLLHATQSERERLAISCKIDDISVDRY